MLDAPDYDPGWDSCARLRYPLAPAEPTRYEFTVSGAAPESNRPSVGLPRRTGFEDRLGHRAHAAPTGRLRQCRAPEDPLVADASGEAVGVEALEQELCCTP